MKKGNHKKLLYRCFACIIACGAIYGIGQHIFGARAFSFSLDSQLSAQMHNVIKDTVKESYFGSLALLAQSIKKACPAAGLISIERCGDNALHIICKADMPWICLADHMLLLKTGTIVEKRCFTDVALQDLPLLSFKDGVFPSQLSVEFKQWLLGLDTAIFAQYGITWADDYEIYLTDKSDKHKTIICSVDTKIDEKIREKCQRIINEKNIDAQGTARWCLYTADIRFDKQIIICSRRGGAYHG